MELPWNELIGSNRLLCSYDGSLQDGFLGAYCLMVEIIASSPATEKKTTISPGSEITGQASPTPHIAGIVCIVNDELCSSD